MTPPLDMVVLNDRGRYHLVQDLIRPVPGPAAKADPVFDQGPGSD